MRIVSLKYDSVFREVFRHAKVRAQFLSDVLGIPLETIRSTRIVNSYLWQRHRKDKQGILDVAMELNDDTRIDVELQVHSQEEWVKRELFYLAKLYTDDLKTGEDYSRLRRCISISILDFKLLESPEYHNVYRLRNSGGSELTDIWEVHIIELVKPLTGESGIEDWIRLFNATSRKELEMIGMKNSGLAEAVQAIKEFGLGRVLRNQYEAHLKEVRDRRGELLYERRVGREEGREEGKAEGKAEAILELLEEKGKVHSDLRAEILGEKDIDTLNRWLKIAAKADSLSDFRTMQRAVDSKMEASR